MKTTPTLRERNPAEQGDTVRENWSGIEGTVMELDEDRVLVQWPARALWSRQDWLVVMRRRATPPQ
ncbi:hypothetical protein [Mycobacteroides abscessus]|uniref:Uncharacterized protein n=1 Tax=Mycobacteroides abscessus TaxID=36809 RepID=A0A0U0ZRA8_9MYCO|nr:hypothetical protein [Mycobacteroides abscessus]CPV66865.1 Uncharacterised protein [Mycobacteroides abscessus]